MLANLVTSALIAHSTLAPYNKYAVHNIVRDGIVYAEPYYGTQGDYMSQGIPNAFHIYDADIKNKVTPDLSQLFGIYNIYIINNGKKQNLFTSTITITHKSNQPIVQQGNTIILKDCMGSDGNTYEVEVDSYSSDLTQDFMQFFKTTDFSQISQLSNYKLKLDRLRQICVQAQDNAEWEKSFNQQVENMDFQIGESEASFIVNVVGDPPTFYSPKDVFAYGNKLIEEGKLTGIGMQLNGDCSDLMQLPHLSGILYNYTNKPKPVKQNEKTVAQIQTEQMQQYNKEQSKKQQQQPENNEPQVQVPNTQNNLPINFNTNPRRVPFIIEVMEFFMRWIFVIIGVCVGIFGVCLYMLLSDKEKKREFKIETEDKPKKARNKSVNNYQDEEFLDFKRKIDEKLNKDDW